MSFPRDESRPLVRKFQGDWWVEREMRFDGPHPSLKSAFAWATYLAIGVPLRRIPTL